MWPQYKDKSCRNDINSIRSIDDSNNCCMHYLRPTLASPQHTNQSNHLFGSSFEFMSSIATSIVISNLRLTISLGNYANIKRRRRYGEASTIQTSKQQRKNPQHSFSIIELMHRDSKQIIFDSRANYLLTSSSCSLLRCVSDRLNARCSCSSLDEMYAHFEWRHRAVNCMRLNINSIVNEHNKILKRVRANVNKGELECVPNQYF